MSFFRLRTLLLAICLSAGAAESHNVIHCRIYDMSGKLVRLLPGMLCAFFEDGSFASGILFNKKPTLTFYDSNLKVLWQKPVHVHHQINPSIDKKRVLVISSEIRDYLGKKVRFDVLKVFSRQGVLLNEWSLFDHRSKLIEWLNWAPYRLMPFSWDIGSYPKVKWEFSHVNSFYEIPQNEGVKANPAFAAGNFIVNASYLNLILVLDSNLKKVLWRTSYPHAGERSIHDVQVVKNGNLLIYNNYSGGTKTSSLDEWNPHTGELIWSFKENPPTKFFADKMGGVQILENGNILFSDWTGGGKGIEIKRSGEEVWRMPFPGETNLSLPVPRALQQIKRFDLSEFLKNNPGV